MDDKMLLNIIKDTAEYEVNADFSHLMSRIENQTDEQREQSRKEALQLMPENNFHMNRNLRNIISIAAAAVITIGLGAVLIAASLGGFGASVAESEAPSYDCMAEESAPMQESPDFLADSEVNTDDEGIKLNGDEKYEVNLNTSVSGGAGLDGFVSCRVNQLGITVDMPENAYITDRTVDNDFILLEKYDITAAQLEANYKKSGIYYNAVWYDGDADATEIVITKRTDELSESLFNLKNAGSYDLGRIKEKYLSYGENSAVSGAEYFDVSTVSNNQAIFLRSFGKVDNAEERSNHLQYMTIVNGDRIEITLIEHFGIDSDLTGEEPEKVSDAHAEMMENIIDSLEWDNIRSGFLKRFNGITLFSIIALVGAAAIAASMISDHIKQKKKKNEESLCNEESETIAENDDSDGIPEEIQTQESSEADEPQAEENAETENKTEES